MIRFYKILIAIVLLELSWNMAVVEKNELASLACIAVFILMVIANFPVMTQWFKQSFGIYGKWVSGFVLALVGVVAVGFLSQSVIQHAYDPSAKGQVQAILAMVMISLSLSLIVFIVGLIPLHKYFTSEFWINVLEVVNSCIRTVLIGLIASLILLGLFDHNGLAAGVSAFIFFWIIVMLILRAMIQPLLRRISRGSATYTLMHVQRAIKSNLPLVHVLESSSRSEAGLLGERLKSISSQLQQGLSISDAIAMSMSELSLTQIKMLQASDRIGRLPQALDRLVADRVRDEKHRSCYVTPNWRYLLINLSCLILLSLFVMVVMYPRLIRIFEDHDIELPWVTIQFNQFMNWMGGTMSGQILPGMVYLIWTALLIVILVIAMKLSHHFMRWVQCGLWYLPVIRLWQRPAHFAIACHQLADGLEADLPLESSVHMTVDVLDHPVVYKQFQRWHEQLNDGVPIASAALKAGLPKVFCSMLGSEPQQQNLPEVSRYLADYYATLAFQRKMWVQAVYAPAITILLGIPVAWFCFAMFSPLVALIQNCAEVSGAF